MDIIGRRNIFLIFSGLLVLISWFLILFGGLKPGIDLRGGAQWQISLAQNIAVQELKNALKDANISVKSVDDNTFLINFPPLSEEKHQEYLKILQDKFGDIKEDSFVNIGPTIGAELKRKAIWAIVLVLIAISLYIAWAFRKITKQISSFKYGAITLMTLFHDVSIAAGFLAFLGLVKGIEIDTNFIVALLVILGFSVHDTIVVFDRIRENLFLKKGKDFSLAEVVNQSVNQTLIRSINTSLTLIFVLIAFILVGPKPLLYFVLTILVGTVFGTYSSIFVASPLLYLWGRKR